ncbi:hypothetical protein JCM8097_003954 [Rhodosporidiobolus ruineniae]
MSEPRTPTKPRTASPLSPSASRPATPVRATPGGVARVKGGGGGVGASPQVKAALAAMRKARQASSSSSSNTPDDASASAQDPFSTPAKPTSNHSRASTSASTASGSRGGSPTRSRRDEVQLEWAVKGEDKLIEEAKKSGRLNLASRTLTSVPPAVYSSLLPRTSSYHPLNRQPRSSYRRDPQPDLTISSIADDEAGTGPTTWYEQQDLRTLNLSSNEIEELGDEIGGFEDLEVLDLHNNHLPHLPISLAWLTHLTSLNLSHNRLSSFPLQLLNLRHLRDLSLAGNQLTHLWPADWREPLSDILKPPGASPSATPESAERGGESFWDSFPSSPFHRANRSSAADLPHPSQSRAPFPLLTALSLGSNPLARDALLEEGFEFPPRLTTLDLSECELVDLAVPPEVLGRLKQLQELDLSGNDLADDLFSSDLFPSSASSSSRLFPSLRTLDLSLNSIDSLASLESFLSARIRRPLSYVGLAKPIQNLISASERDHRSGRRIGLPLSSPGEGEEEEGGPELEVKVRECLMREEQVRRRRGWPESEASRRREEEAAQARRAEKEKEAGGSAAAPPAPRPRTRSPSPPPSPSPAPSTSLPPPVPSIAAPSTPLKPRRPVVLEDWEVEAAAGLTTPAGRRRAAAQAAKEREERRRAEEERKRDEKQRAEEEEEERVREKLAAIKVEEPTEDTSTTPSSRAESASPPPYSPRAPSPPSPVSPSIDAPPAESPSSSPASAPEPEASASDPAVQLLTSALSAPSTSRSVLTLTSRSLAAVPVPSSGRPPAALQGVTSVDLSRNQLPLFPLRAIETWGWGRTLRSLSLANNRVAAFEVLSSAAVDKGEPFFPALEVLDLAHNHLPSVLPSSPFPSSSSSGAEEPIPLFAALARLAPILTTLTLTHNRLTSLPSLSALLFPPSDGKEGKSGLKHLHLAENKISELEGLIEAARAYDAAGREERKEWRLEEIDLSANEIAKLPPHLGLLPPSLLLHLTGNTFRLPRREVYENAAERKVVPWCKEWLDNLEGR